MKKIFLALSVNLALISVFLIPVTVLADQDYGLSAAANRIGYQAADASLMTKLQLYIGIAMGVVGIIFFGMMMYAGVRWLTARGKDELAEKAKNALEAAVTGLVITMLAWGITSFVITQLSKGKG